MRRSHVKNIVVGRHRDKTFHSLGFTYIVKGKNMRTIVFHPYGFCGGVACTYQETKELINNPYADFVRTTQMCFLNTNLFDKGFNFILIFGEESNVYISIDDAGVIHCPNTDRVLRKSHNLFKLWQAGEFD